ncbi:thiamine phosphate synthase [Clostridium beijerinckii]|uniref:thiamine phosphate synthase n=1 Tax=Clostridium beijerinckii TaxID=1520 RepID=UPI00047E0B18|nr:thiamine phosphate synthase [Clostridium beijerinckii]
MSIVGITNRKLCKDFFKQIKKISESNLDCLIIREKDLSSEELMILVLKVKEELKGTNIRIIINSNIDIAKRADADGVQLSFNDFINISNKLYTGKAINSKDMVDNFEFKGNKYKIYKMVGVSIHSYEEGIQAAKLGADYVIYGHVFETDCKKGLQPRGIKEIEALSKDISIPIIGIGGINKENFKEILNAGASGIAIMSSLMKDKNPEELIKSLSK